MNISNILIRKAAPGDLHDICDIENACFPQPWTFDDFKKDLIDNTFAIYFLAEFEGSLENRDEEIEAAVNKDTDNTNEIAGFISLHILFENAQIVNLAVLPQFRGMGIGMLLIYEAIKYCMLSKCDSITLEVRVSNSYAIKLYEAVGFIAVGIRKSYYSDNGEDAYLMLLTLS